MLQSDYSAHLLPESSRSESTRFAEQFLQSALDALPAHVAILDEQGVIIGVNRAWRHYAEVNGMTMSSYGMGTNYLQICDHATGRSSQEAVMVGHGIRDVIAHRRDEFDLEYPCHSPGQKSWFLVQVSRFEWHGRTSLIMAHQNVTELKQVQIKLEENRKRLEAILNNVVNGIVTISASGRLKTLNPAALAIFGYEAPELVGQSLNILFAAPERELPLRRLLEQLNLHPHQELVGRRKDGSLFPMLFGISELMLDGRRMYTGIVQDITERKLMEAELLEKERITLALSQEREMREFKSRFMSMMSHELRTPLSSILLSSDLLKHYGDRAEPEEKQLYLENISTQVEHLAALIKEMLSMSRSEKREMEFAPQVVDLSALCRQMLDEYRIMHPGCILHLTHPETDIVTMLDPRLMRQVLNNLLSNAIKYSVPPAIVQLDLTRTGNEIQLRITDSGIGIPQADIPLLFQP
ncbi:MAG TPA: PAS domain S-box protein, partial [Phototrophicaceae bacterium]|nr:PAS domain S-box protein [Phototrophicaceae bacterium]